MPSVRTKRPSSQTYQIGVTCGQPSSRMRREAADPQLGQERVALLRRVSAFAFVAVVRFSSVLRHLSSSTIAAARTGEP